MRYQEERILVVSPHPDDETLGAGGTLLSYKAKGAKIFWLNITDISHSHSFSQEQKEKRSREIEEVKTIYDFDGFYNLCLEPAHLFQYAETELIHQISAVIHKVKPTSLFLPYEFDIHSDHGIVFRACFSCTKWFRYPFLKKIFAMEIVSETDFSIRGFQPNYFVDISDYLKKKNEILRCYESEIQAPPFPRSIENVEALATIRGSSAGFRYGEGFLLLKYIED